MSEHDEIKAILILSAILIKKLNVNGLGVFIKS